MKKCKRNTGKEIVRPFFSCKLTILLIAALSISGCDTFEAQKYVRQKSKKNITIALPFTPPSSPLFVAFDKGYFKEEGLDVVVIPKPSGKASLEAVTQGEADFAAVGEVPIMLSVLNDERIYAIASYMSTIKNYVIVARKDKGIHAPADFSGKRIGVTLGTNSEFFMDVFFMYKNIRKDEVEIVNLTPPEMYNALMNGTVDAVSTWNPHVIRLQKSLSDKQITFDGDGAYTGRFNIAAMQDFIKTNPTIAPKFLRALQKGIKDIRDKPNESLQIVSKNIKIGNELIKEIWGFFDFNITLSQSLLVTLEDEAKWAIRAKLTNKPELPNFLDYIYMDAMAEVKPDSITIIR